MGTQARRESVSILFRVLPNLGGNVFYFFYKITRRKLKRGNSLLIEAYKFSILFVMAYAMVKGRVRKVLKES